VHVIIQKLKKDCIAISTPH